MNKKNMLLILVIAAALFIITSMAGAGDFCDLAPDMLQKAATVFKKDQKEGLKLFIKARKLCDSRETSYNLGLAFYQYGDIEKAQMYLKEAVGQSCTNPVWLNNLACAVLDGGQDPKQALAVAQKAYRLDKQFKPGLDTLSRALFAAGNRLEALKVIDKAVQANPGTSYLKETADRIMADYSAFYLALIKTGEMEKGLAGLARADFKEKPAEMLCRVLGRLNRLDEGINKSAVYQERFSPSKTFKQIHDELMSRKIQGFYALFQSGDDRQAVLQAKAFSESHPGSTAASKAYNELFNAMMGDVTDIRVPQVAAARSVSAGPGRDVDVLLGGIGSVHTPVQADLDLSIDVETDIPKARRKNPNAVALIIANQQYRRMNKGLPDVRFAERDAAIMKKYLMTAMGYANENIITAYNATSGDFRTLLGTPQNPKGKLHQFVRPDSSSDLFVYYVGHGSPGPQGKSAFLVPVDAAADYIQNNGYALDLFYRVMETLPVRSKTIVLDACFSGESAGGNLFKNISPAMLKTAAPIRQMETGAVFCATDKDQVATWYPAKRHSLFSYYFFKGLQGAADTDHDRVIRLSELEQYLQKEVYYRAGRESNRVQTPKVMGKKDYVIAELR